MQKYNYERGMQKYGEKNRGKCEQDRFFSYNREHGVFFMLGTEDVEYFIKDVKLFCSEPRG
jgi:hypothetical protein